MSGESIGLKTINDYNSGGAHFWLDLIYFNNV
jgi:hypothetical protein